MLGEDNVLMKKLGDYLNQRNRNRLATKIKTARRLDHGKSIKGKIWRKNRSLETYSGAMRINLESKIQRIILTKGSCKMLDIGCGDCHALAEAKHLFGSKVKTHGIRLFGKRDYKTFAEELVQGMADKIMVGSIENYIFKDKYDMIVSFAGIHYTANAALAIEKVANALSIGGEAHLQMKKTRLPKALIEQIQKQGFEVTVSTQPGYPTIIHMKRTSKRAAELTPFIIKEARAKINPKVNVKERLNE